MMPARSFNARRLGIAIAALLFAIGGWYTTTSWFPSTSDLKNRCRRAADAGNWILLESIASRWAQVEPSSGEPWLQLAEAQRRQHKYQLASDALDHVPPESPDSEAALIAQMELQFGPLNRPEDAALTCERILAINPKSATAQQRLIFFLTLTLQRTRLRHQIRTAIEAGAEPMEAYIYLFFIDSLAFSNGAETNGRWLRGDPNSELFEVSQAIFISELLDLSISMDDFAGAQAARRDAARKSSVLQKLLTRYPHNAELLAYNIRQRMQTGDVAEVVQLLAQATVECEDDPRFWRFKGWVHAQRNQMVDADKSYRRAIELNPMDWTTRQMLAEVYQHEKRFDDVTNLRNLVARGSQLHNSLRHAPNARQVDPEILLQLADYAADCGDKQFSEALRRRIQQNRGS